MQKPSSQRGSLQDAQVLLTLRAEALDSRSHPPSVCGDACEERDSFIPPGRNVIISITDEMLPQEAFYASLLALNLRADSQQHLTVYISFTHSLDPAFTARL